MAKKRTDFTEIGKETDHIDVRLSYKIIELFSEGLYASPNKAVEELVANSFDAGAQHVQVLVSDNLHAQDATIVIIDDGVGMDTGGLKQHWLIGSSNKRELAMLPRGRQQIGKFGIGKLATYVLATRLTHITKSNGRYHSTSMNYGRIDRSKKGDVAPRAGIRIPLRTLSEAEAKAALAQWTQTAAFKRGGTKLFASADVAKCAARFGRPHAS
jgi:HSP90 family molecular chaperone